MHGLKTKYSDQIEFVMLDFDDISLNPTRRKYGITDRSQYVLIDGNDQVVHRWYGFLDPAEVEQVLDSFLTSS
ncbi:MAG: hypothetical protein K8J31_18880 [Anaerolineae bacterium]|nr:hypothetical protein [Anaerolineae bacterium]